MTKLFKRKRVDWSNRQECFGDHRFGHIECQNCIVEESCALRKEGVGAP
jgi:hypothetical protein